MVNKQQTAEIGSFMELSRKAELFVNKGPTLVVLMAVFIKVSFLVSKFADNVLRNTDI